MSEHTYTVTDGPKTLRETLCIAQTWIGLSQQPDRKDHIGRLGRLIDECDRKRPVGSDGKHDDRHTPECGCEDASADTLRNRIAETLRENGMHETAPSTIHSWRCEYPERYGPCPCFAYLVDDLQKLIEAEVIEE